MWYNQLSSETAACPLACGYQSEGNEPMEYRNLGRAGVRVSPLWLGTAQFGGRVEAATAIDLVHAALDAGINVLDTANIYTQGRSEELVGQAIKGRRGRIVLASKVYNKVGDGPNDRGSSRYHIMAQIEASLRRLQTDHLDLYQLHRPDPTTPHRGDVAGIRRPPTPGQGPLFRHFNVPGVAALRGTLDQ